MAGSSSIGLIGIAIVGSLLWFTHHPELTKKDTVVLADFDNRTGDAVFDDTLKQALAVHLEQSPFINVLSDEKVNAILQLMGRAPGDRLSAPVARDVCQRGAAKQCRRARGNKFIARRSKVERPASVVAFAIIFGVDKRSARA